MSFSEGKESHGLSSTPFIRPSVSRITTSSSHKPTTLSSAKTRSTKRRTRTRTKTRTTIPVTKSPKHTVLTSLTPVTPRHSTVLTTAKPKSTRKRKTRTRTNTRLTSPVTLQTEPTSKSKRTPTPTSKISLSVTRDESTPDLLPTSSSPVTRRLTNKHPLTNETITHTPITEKPTKHDYSTGIPVIKRTNLTVNDTAETTKTWNNTIPTTTSTGSQEVPPIYRKGTTQDIPVKPATSAQTPVVLHKESQEISLGMAGSLYLWFLHLRGKNKIKRSIKIYIA